MKMARQHLLLIGLLCSMSVACAPAIHAVQDYQTTFVCDGEQRVHVRFAPFKAVLESQGVSVAMIQQTAADGFLYTGGGQSLRQRGHEATWTDGKGALHHCRESVAASPKGDTAAH
jgi:Membrane-bound lysozyme-inhibitor of c-type lysozyme